MEPAKTPPKAQGGSGNPDPRIAELEAHIADLTTKLAQMTDIAGRAQADLQNAKIRMKKDADEFGKFAVEGFLKKLLPTIDNFQRAFKHLPEDLKNNEWARPELVEWVKGITAIEQDLMRQMTEMGLTKMECLGQQVDTARHEVVTIGPGTEGEIIQVIEDGYELNGKILRPAKVIVGSGQ